jgi:hypothetical protein
LVKNALPEFIQGDALPSNPPLTSSCDEVVLAVTVKVSVLVRVNPPPTAVKVRFVVASVAVVEAVRVKVELPLPGAAILAGEKVAVTPAGNGAMLKASELLNPPDTVVVTDVVALAPLLTERVVAAVVTAKSGVLWAVIVNPAVTVLTMLPLVAVTVIVYVPGAAVPLLTDSVEPLPAVTELAENVALAPVGRPLAASEIDPVNPPVAVVLRA